MFSYKTLLLSAFLWFTGVSCINTSYSRHDEVEISNDEVHLVLGMFAHHGIAFYDNEVARTTALLKLDPKNFVARNDLASAYIKLKKYKLAENEFNLNEQYHPGRYETSANRGVLYKKMERYEDAASALRKSFEIKPAGHMGLGDYYLKMVEWLAEQQAGVYGAKTVDFLGNTFDDVAGVKADKEYLLTLIKNDYKFADAYFVLGKVYQKSGDFQMAVRCYQRAIYLEHPEKDFIDSMMSDVFVEMEAGMKPGQVMDLENLTIQLRDEQEGAEVWLAKYQAYETVRLEEGLPVDFKTMKSLYVEADIEKPAILEAGVFMGVSEDGRYSGLIGGQNMTIAFGLVFFVVLSVIIGAIVWIIRKMTKPLTTA